MEDKEFKIEIPKISITYWILIIVLGLILPMVLIPIIKFTGYSEIFEEIAKFLVIFILISKFQNHKIQIFAGLLFGFLFGLSENFLYLNQIMQNGNLDIFWQRFIWTVPMHIVTSLIMVFAGLAHKWLIIFGLIGAIILHALFNGILVVNLF